MLYLRYFKEVGIHKLCIGWLEDVVLLDITISLLKLMKVVTINVDVTIQVHEY